MPTQALLIEPSELSLWGASSDFLRQFKIRQLEVLISTAGALGTMAIQWRVRGEETWEDVIPSEAGSTWSVELDDPGFATLAFEAGSYVVDTTYIVGTSGAVTLGAGAISGLSAVRFDVVTQACQAATKKGVTWMLPRVVPPVLSVGEQVKEWLASLAIYTLRSRKGMSPTGAGVGDDNLRARALDAETNLKEIGRSEDRPPDLVDSSSSGAGAGLSVYPTGDDLTGW